VEDAVTERVKLGIAIPSGGMWQADFGMSYGNMLCRICTDDPIAPEWALHLANKGGSMLPVNRTWLVKEMQAREVTHILWLDDDMTFPVDTAHRLLAHGKSVVGCNASRKNPPYAPTAVGLDRKHCFTTAEKSGLEEVLHVGMAVMLTDIRVFRGLPEPWFPMSWSAEMQRYVGEDVFFCHLMRQRGIKVWVDHDLSKEVGHIGPHTYTTDLAEAIEKA
jgi:hypothetical protein